ncbi:hypothetical protein A3K86_14980 [Photobacterium jeanii]|uniref:Peptidase S1 domain-containing protein n=1 Tax=Photobacterium jeanii TaxID=858640 RepID=A0A178K8F1_9GAMM|nr:serine protease [Photobacterium jeanii]OAN12972.1 hypothetical protein A3K86_14980 [Photobacterium jeanii]
MSRNKHLLELQHHEFLPYCSFTLKPLLLSIGLATATFSPAINAKVQNTPQGDDSHQVVPRIIDGDRTTVEQHPWMASLRLSVMNEVPLCGATIIDSHWALTAAHCVVMPGEDPSQESGYFVLKPYQISVTAGITTLSTAPIDSFHAVTHVVVHPKYTRLAKVEKKVGSNGSVVTDVKALALDSDIALLRVSRPFPDHLTRIKLTDSQTAGEIVDTLEQQWAEGQKQGERPSNLRVTGWGATAIDGSSDSAADELQTAKVSYLPMADCYERMEGGDTSPSIVESPFNLSKVCSLPFKITNQNINSDIPPYGPDVCKGDSGGPLTYEDNSGNITQLGIMSGVSGGSPLCGSINQPAFYTRIGTYYDWIQSYLGTVPDLAVIEPDFIKNKNKNPNVDPRCDPNVDTGAISPNNCNFIEHDGGSVNFYLMGLLSLLAFWRRRIE